MSRFLSVAQAQELGVNPDALALLVQAGPLCFLDFEATGLEPTKDALIEAGAALVRADADDVEIFNTFVQTQLLLTPFIRRLTGIGQDDVRNAPSLAEVAPALDAFIGNVPVVAHNARFEQAWLSRYVSPRFAEHVFLDTVELLALVYPDSPSMKLDTFCRTLLARKERHRALDDALDTLRVVADMVGGALQGSTRVVHARNALRSFHNSSPWLPALAHVPAVVPDQAPEARAGGERPPSLRAVPFVYEAIHARLADVTSAGRLFPGYEFRSGQAEMVRRVHQCFSGIGGKTVHACEAGTGIGKTLAYLAVAIPFARKTGEQVIVSTSTKLLQSQLMEKDIPAAARLMGYPDLRFTAMKGRANYLCRVRLDGFLDDAAAQFAPSDSLALAYVSAFSNNTSHGEVDRVPQVLLQMNPELERFRREVSSAEAGECSRQTCETTRAQCVFRDARRRLEGAEIVVVNHDLLLRWPPDYPPLRHLIVDELHELAERADGAYARVVDAVEILHRIDAPGRDADLARRLSDRYPGLAARAKGLVESIGSSARSLAGSTEAGAGFSQTYFDDLPLPSDGPGPAWKELITAGLELADALDDLSREIAAATVDDASGAPGVADALLDAATVLRESLPAPATALVVRFRGLARPSNTSWRLVATPVSPAADFQLEVLDQVETFFGTSATLAVGEHHAAALGSLEFEERAGSRFCMGPPIASPFDYRRNLLVLFVDERLDASRLVESTVGVIAGVAGRLGGRTLGLFTSRDRLSTVSDRLDETLRPAGISVVAPSTGTTDPHDLVRTFLESDHAVLLGARAFWQGVDIPGDACQALVIEKLPFDVPNDPLIQRRGELIEEAGGNAFGDYMLPRMLLRLKQMIGRLIRTPTDRGVVVIVDSRSDKRYFPRLQDALPPEATHRKVKFADLDAALADFFKSSDGR